MATGIYDLSYYEKMLREYSDSAHFICKTRWEFVSEINPEVVLDYGSGVGWFRAFRPKGVIVDTYDLGNFPQTGVNQDHYDLLCLWDVLEHIPNFTVLSPVFQKASHVAVSLPVKPEDVKFEDWKHFKPLEHLHYFSVDALVAFFKKFHFKNLRVGTPECPPRLDIVSALFKKEE